MRTLRSRLTLTHTLIALIAVVAVTALATILIQRGFDRLAAERGRNQARDIAQALGDYYNTHGNLTDAPAVIRQRILDQGGALPRRIVLANPDWRVIFDTREGILSLRGRILLPFLREQATPVRAADGRIIAYVLAPVSDTQDLSQYERDFLARVYLSMILGSLLAGAVALVVGVLIATRLTRPLRRLTDAARRLAAGERHDPLPPPPDAELAELAAAFNTMAADLEHQQQLRRQLIADIAHELRTPLSVLRLQLESIEDGIEQPTPTVLASLAEEVGVLTRLVDDLRLLSLADAGQLSLAIGAVDAGEALAHAVTAASARARRQGIHLRYEPPAGNRPLLVAADPQRLTQMLGNLVENALRYTPRGGHVTLRVAARHDTRQYGDVVIEVADTGPGIPPEELARVFDRFYRADRARARETGGSGLGLAIVQRLAEMQGGRVWATSVAGQGTSFFIALPVAGSMRATQLAAPLAADRRH